MQLELTAKSRIPHGGYWHWTDPITKVQIEATNWEMLLTFIYKERKANGVPCGLDFEKEVERDLCASKPEECEWVDQGVPRRKQLSFGDVLRGTTVLLNFKRAGSPLVDPQEASRRAAICSNCPFNVQFDRPCAGACGPLLDIVKNIIGGTGTSFDESSKSCSICSCYTAAHVQIPLDILATGLNDDMKRAFNSLSWCWKHVQV